MNEKIKMFFSGIVAGIIFIGSVIFSIFIRTKRHPADSNAGDGIERARETCESAGETSTELAGTTQEAIRIEQEIAGTNEQFTESIGKSRQIIDELKKRHTEG